MESIPSVARTVSIAGGIGILGFATLQTANGMFFQRHGVHEALKHTTLLKESELGKRILNLSTMTECKAFEDLVNLCELFLTTITSVDNGAQFTANRIFHAICRICDDSVQAARNSRNFDLIDQSIFSERDYIPAIKQFCEAEILKKLMQCTC